jgi:hypothetical protein
MANFHPQGNGGQGQFWWIDNLGTQPFSEIEKFDFNLLPNRPQPQGPLTDLVGSYLRSTPIRIEGGKTLTLRATIANANEADSAYQTVGFGLLLQQGIVKYVLFAIRPDNVGRFGDMGPNAPQAFAPPSPGVDCVFTPFPIPPQFSIGGIDYSKYGDAATAINATCGIDAAGEYELVIGVFVRGGVGNPERPAGLIVWSTDVA